MKRKSQLCRLVSVSLFLTIFSCDVSAEIVLKTVGVPIVETFDGYQGLGFSPSPGAGVLDSNTYRAEGFSDGDGEFGGTYLSGDFARGTSLGGEDEGGGYAFEVATGDFALGVQPTEEDFTPGFLTIAARNDTGETLAGLLVTADAMFFNDQDRSTLWNFQGSVDDVNYSTLFSLQSIEARDANPAWVAESVGGEISLGPGLPSGGAFFIRVAGSDLGGTGDRDEFALNNLSITGLTSLTVIPEPSSLAALCVCCGVVAVRRRHRH